MARRDEESDKTIKSNEGDSGRNSERDPATKTARTAFPESAPGRPVRRHRARDRNALRTGLRRASALAASLIGFAVMIICVVLALHIAFVVFSANQDNSIVRTVDDWADWFAWRFRDIFVPKDERVRVLVNNGIAAAVYLIAGRIAANLIRRIR